MKNKRQNTLYKSNIISPLKKEKYLNPIEECPETDDIIKKLDNLDFSSDGKSFETPYISLSKTKTKKYVQSNSISIPYLINDNSIEDFPLELKSKNNEDIFYYKNISNILNNNDNNKKEEKNNIIYSDNNNDIYFLLLKEKINRICINIQNYNINEKYYNIMINFICCLNNIINNNLYTYIDSIFDVILELFSKIKGEYKIKEELTIKLNNMSLNKEDYEKKIFEIKKELIYKEKEIETLLSEKDNKKKEIKNNSNKKLILEINTLKKENQLLFEKILSYKTKIKSICSDYINLHDKYKICLKEIDKKEEKDKKCIFIKQNIIEFSLNKKLAEKNNTNNINLLNKINEIPSNIISPIKKLTSDLILFLFDVNKMLFKYDFALVKMNKIKNIKMPLNDIKDLNPNIDINYLLNERNYKIFSKYFFCNMDIIYNKIININKGNNNNFNSNSNSNNNLKELKRFSGDKKKINGKIKSLNNSRVNQSINLYLPESNVYAKNFKSYISIKKNRENKNLVRNSTSRNGFSFLNFYSDTDLEGNFIIKKEMNNKIDKKFSHTVNLEKNKKGQNSNEKNINGAKNL